MGMSMARAIKFRAWDKAAEAMLDWGLLTNLIEGSKVAGVPKADLKQYKRMAPDNLSLVVMRQGNPFKIADYTLMQFTGLKDKNGVEIYEGDILGKRPYGYLKSDGAKDGRYKGKEWQCFAVEWGEFDASEAGLVSGYEYETDGKYAGWNIVVGGYDDDLENNEVIGNIYENSELLT